MTDLLIKELLSFQETPLYPSVIVGHGSPMNAISDNQLTRNMKEAARKLPKPSAILMVSAQWETLGTYVTDQDHPPTIHDFGGFPQALFEVQYPAPGSPTLVKLTQAALPEGIVQTSTKWGFDHGA